MVVATDRAKDAVIAGCAAVRVLKEQMPEEPILEPDSSRTEEFAAAMGATGRVSLMMSGFVHGKILCSGEQPSYKAVGSQRWYVNSFC